MNKLNSMEILWKLSQNSSKYYYNNNNLIFISAKTQKYNKYRIATYT